LGASGSQSHPSKAAAGTTLQVPANLSVSSDSIKTSCSSTHMHLLLSAGPAEVSTSRNAAGHAAAPSALQLPEFSAFMLPEECAFAESSMDDALTTPTPHTPVVPNMFAGEGLPVSSAQTLCLPSLTIMMLHGLACAAGNEPEAPIRHTMSCVCYLQGTMLQ
jgi:hypothetical protein